LVRLYSAASEPNHQVAVAQPEITATQRMSSDRQMQKIIILIVALITGLGWWWMQDGKAAAPLSRSTSRRLWSGAKSDG
jgi:hypothetical protein